MQLAKDAFQDQFKPAFYCILEKNVIRGIFACHVTFSRIPCYVNTENDNINLVYVSSLYFGLHADLLCLFWQ